MFVQRKQKTVRPRKAVILDSDNEEDMVRVFMTVRMMTAEFSFSLYLVGFSRIAVN